MSVTVVIGAQWGDEAKGKFVDLLSQTAVLTARFNGGDNAGHTVVNPYGTFKLRLTPNGFSNPATSCIIGPGVVVNLATLLTELEMIRQAGIALDERLWVSPRCHVVMPYHPRVEAIYERTKGKASTGTTGRGMGPVYADKVSYNGIRLADLDDEGTFASKLHTQIELKNALLRAYNEDALDFLSIYEEKLSQFARLRHVVREPFGLIQTTLQHGEEIVLEGAQGTLLDNDWGTYPFCTASTTLAGGAAAGLGIAPRWIDRVVGVVKAYTTRVGAGPMPTELIDETGEAIRQAGAEFGTVTGRPRRCGWFDAELVRFAAALNGCTTLALTKLDVLDSLPRLKIGMGYCPRDGELAHYWEGDAHWLDGCQPEYLEVEGWQQPTGTIRQWHDLPRLAQAFVRKVEELVETPIGWVSVGPERDATIVVPSI